MAEDRARVELDVGLGADRTPARPAPETPFAVLVLGDFGGGGKGAAGRRPVAFDRDDVDAAIARVEPRLTYAAPGGASVVLRFNQLEDFHPDSLYENVALFRSLRDLRERLSDPATFASAASEVSGSGTPKNGTARRAAATLAGGSLLDRMLEDEPASRAGSTGGAREDDLAAFVRQAVTPHLVPGEDPRQAEMLAGVDAALATQMRALLHDRRFQTLESAWRTVDFLARRIETGTQLRLYLLDLSRAALDTALATEGGAVALARHLADAATAIPNGVGWSVIAGLYEFGPDDADALQVAQLGAIARRLGAPLLAGAAPSFAGRSSWAALPEPGEWTPPESQTWSAVRATPEAAAVALVGPRFLLRDPYGPDGEPTEAFDFEEVDAPPPHDRFLWGNGAAACALLLAEAFDADGWELGASAQGEVRGLPLHVYREAGEAVALPCAETLLGERAAHRLMELGVTPIASLKDTDTIRVIRLQSVAAPPTRLAAAWSTG